ncbi:DUF3108 domain-containing protein [uncultured Roseibium sp.]|uniref:DUF3108 domain-containing protein n=1 Tax=uncultured Roseibium sp. TaxID=1936171 RepID=UPI0026160AA6|nr:DUF3108 domain-containing protein [uncultured Roseibium sp.]
MRSFLLSAFAIALTTGQASSADLYMKYKLYAVGLPIGSGVLNVDLDNTSYSIDASGGTAAFGKLVSDGKGNVSVRGDNTGGQLSPQKFSLDVNSEDETGTITMQMSKGALKKVAVNPPQDRMNERIKVTRDHLKNVLDPLTAAVFPAPKGLSKESCNRTLSLFDGKERYNVHLSYKSKRNARTADGRFNGKVLVCRARYEPVAGHRPKRKTIQELAKNKSMEIWLAPVGDKPFLVPLRASITAPFGPLVVKAEKYKLSK